MLRIYPVCLQMVRDVRPYAERIEKRDRTTEQVAVAGVHGEITR